jgi:biopolymer transport protein ExbB
MSWFEPGWFFFKAGGPVMPFLLLVSIWLWVAILAKMKWLWQVRGERFGINEARMWLQGGESSQTTRLDFKRAVLADFLGRRSGVPEQDIRFWRASVLALKSDMNRHLAVIVVLAAVAPLLGLLGTVNGMINTFDAIQRFGTGNAQAMAAGISEALITTQAGLMVAIPGLMAGYYLKRQVRKEKQRLEEFQQMVEGWLQVGEAERC